MRYELQAGRLILKDGKRFCNLHGCHNLITGERSYDPAELDKFARDIVERFNTADTNTGCQAIMTKYLGPGNRLGTRVKATAAAGSITLHWDDRLNSDQNHLKAARALADKFGWTGRLIGGGRPDCSGNAYVMEYHRGE